MELKDWETEAQEISVEKLDSAVKNYRELREQYEEKKKESNAAYAEAEKAKSTLVEMLESAGKEKYHVKGVANVLVYEKPKVRTPKDPEAKKAFFDWLAGKGVDIYSMATVNHNTLNSFVKQEMEENPEEAFSIPGLEEPESEKVLSLRKE